VKLRYVSHHFGSGTPAKKTPMLKIGLTGGIGSGKTFVCRIFEELGVPVYYADDRAKWLMQNDAHLVAAIKKAFGENIYSGNQLDRAKLAAMVFNNKQALEKLNNLVHPAVFTDTAFWLEERRESPYTIREAALIFETGSDQLLDKVITVTAPLEIRIQRVMQRDNVPRENVMARVANQMDEKEKVKRADYVIYNDNNHSLMAQIEHIHRELMKLSKA